MKKKSLIQPVGILGFGVEGESSLRYLLRQGIQKIIILDRGEVQLPLDLPSEVSVRVFSGEDYLRGLPDCITVIRSAGVYPLIPELLKFQMDGGILTSQTEIFMQEVSPEKVIGVTGTFGKGSTVSMVEHIFQKMNIPCKVGGNFGIPALDLLETHSENRYSILELSSFQLMTLPVSPHIGVVLHVSTEHLDWHRHVDEYRDAKANLVRFQKRDDYCIYNQNIAASKKIAEASGGIHLAFGNSKTSNAVVSENSVTLDGIILNLNECEVRGKYQLENMAAALLICKALRLDIETAMNALKTYQALPLRMEFRGEFSGIEFYNDSYATRPEATIAAVKSMNRPFALILGGSEKHADFTELAQYLAQNQNLKQIALIGATAKRLFETLLEARFSGKLKVFEDFQSAFDFSTAIGEASAVLLSPACASFGLFKNYKERGEIFNQMIEKWRS